MSDYGNNRPMLTAGDWLFLATLAVTALLLWALSVATRIAP